MNNYQQITKAVINELDQVLSQVDTAEVEVLVNEIIKAGKVFIFAVGRVFLALQCFGKRMGHLGIDCQVVGSVNEKPIGPDDLLLIASGSGESRLPAEIARIAKAKGARIGLITSARHSTIQDMSDFVVRLPSPTKHDPSAGVESAQPMTLLFDQSLHLFGDAVAMQVQVLKGLTNEEQWRRHANLE